MSYLLSAVDKAIDKLPAFIRALKNYLLSAVDDSINILYFLLSAVDNDVHELPAISSR